MKTKANFLAGCVCFVVLWDRKWLSCTATGKVQLILASLRVLFIMFSFNNSRNPMTSSYINPFIDVQADTKAWKVSYVQHGMGSTPLQQNYKTRFSRKLTICFMIRVLSGGRNRICYNWSFIESGSENVNESDRWGVPAVRYSHGTVAPRHDMNVKCYILLFATLTEKWIQWSSQVIPFSRHCCYAMIIDDIT